MYRKTYVEINCETIEKNIRDICKNYPDYKYYFGVVKANAYGHGIEIIKYLIKGGVNYLAVSSLEEALNIRSIDTKIPVLILEPIDLEFIDIVEKNNLTITIDNKDYFDKLLKSKFKIRFHLKVDTGMNRLGFKSIDDINYIYNKSNKQIYLEGIYTHLASGNGDLYDIQIDNFKELTKDIDLNKIDIVHIDRSLSFTRHDKLDFTNGVRLGIVMYGFAQNSSELSWKRKLYNKLTFTKPIIYKNNLNLHTAFTFKTTVLETKEVLPGEIVGYGGAFGAQDKCRIAILPYGFADFMYAGKGEVFIQGKSYKIIGNYMDMTSVLINEKVHTGDEVEIFGNNNSIPKVSRLLGINSYKLFTSVTNRVPRVYKNKDKEKEIKY